MGGLFCPWLDSELSREKYGDVKYFAPSGASYKVTQARMCLQGKKFSKKSMQSHDGWLTPDPKYTWYTPLPSSHCTRKLCRSFPSLTTCLFVNLAALDSLDTQCRMNLCGRSTRKGGRLSLYVFVVDLALTLAPQ